MAVLQNARNTARTHKRTNRTNYGIHVPSQHTSISPTPGYTRRRKRRPKRAYFRQVSALSLPAADH